MNIKIALSVVTLVALTSCASTTGEPSADAGTGTNAPTATPAATQEPPPPPETTTTTTTTPPPPANPTFGEAYTWTNGLSVTVSPPTPFEPSEYALTSEWPAYLAFQIKVVNGSTENYDPTIFMTTLQSGNVEGEEIFDFEQGFEGSPSTTLLPGREATFKVGYGVQNPDDLVLEVTPGFEYESAIFTS